MKIKAPIRIAPIVLSGLLSTSYGYIKKNNNDVIKYLKYDKEVVELQQNNENEGIDLSLQVIAKENSYIYDEANLKSTKLGMLVKGENIKYLGQYDDKWFIVSFAGRECFIKTDNVELIESYEIISAVPSLNSINDINKYLDEMDVVVATSNVNVRKNSNTKSKKLSKLNKGQSLPLIKVLDDWCEVNYCGSSAYVYKKYVQVTKGYYAKTNMCDMVYITSKTPLFDIETNEEIISIPRQEVAEVYASYNDYYLVKCNGLFGFVLKDYTCSLGNDYVIIDISSQNLKVYKDDQLIIDTQIVTGKKSSPTYCGIFDVYKKEENVRWDEFKVTVKYWMPFNRGEGMHDASWRKEFGGEIYKKNGSHGCVNIPVDVMPLIYKNVEVGTPVLVKK